MQGKQRERLQNKTTEEDRTQIIDSPN